MSYLRLLQYSAERRTRYLFTAVGLRQFRLSMKAKSIFYDAECNQSCFVAIARKELNSIDEEPKSWLHDLFLSSTAVNSKRSWTPSFKGIINTCQIPSIELRLVVMSRRMNEWMLPAHKLCAPLRRSYDESLQSVLRRQFRSVYFTLSTCDYLTSSMVTWVINWIVSPKLNKT